MLINSINLTKILGDSFGIDTISLIYVGVTKRLCQGLW